MTGGGCVGERRDERNAQGDFPIAWRYKLQLQAHTCLYRIGACVDPDVLASPADLHSATAAVAAPAAAALVAVLLLLLLFDVPAIRCCCLDD